MKKKHKKLTINKTEIGMKSLAYEIHFGIQLKYKAPHYDNKFNRAKNKRKVVLEY